MRLNKTSILALLAVIVTSTLASGCVVYAPPRGYVVAPVPVVVAPVIGVGFRGGRHW
ncbi:hypothetical protein [Undibacterium sp. SXout20W]|uniref:hypothetical protein n=1 Tax=Undibacterium sp. SXout20W TaxID=3413051 RepID=UPI003BF0219E